MQVDGRRLVQRVELSGLDMSTLPIEELACP